MSAEVEQEHKQQQEIYGSFFLNESEFALAVTYVQEVVNSPDKYTSLPLSQPYLKGLLNLRGSIIPVVDLRTLLNLSESKPVELQKIAIVELDGGCVGLLFDRTGEIFRSNEEEKSEFHDDSKAQVVSGVFKKDEGKRIVQILNVSGLFKLKGVPQDEAKNHRGRSRLANKRGQRKQGISFVVGPAKCAMGIEEIQEILKIEKVSESALGGGHCIGTIDLRGITVPVVDFAALLNYRETDRSAEATRGDRRIVVMRIEKELFGLMVDSVDSIISYYPDEMIKFPILEQSRSDMFIGCIASPSSSDTLLLNHQNILTNSEITEITHGHSKLYNSKSSELAERKKSGGPRKTYITFAIENTYAIGINEIKEIIDYPNELLQPPGLPKHFRGVLNLRGELVTIVDARAMYAANPRDKALGDGKVLVFKRNDMHFGLVVDGVESIVSFSEGDKLKLPQTLYNASNGGLIEDIAEAVQVNCGNGDKRNLLILSADSIALRFSKAIAA